VLYKHKPRSRVGSPSASRAHVLSIGIKPNAAQEEELAVGQLREEAKDW
jgi:hypothetical protein